MSRTAPTEMHRPQRAPRPCLLFLLARIWSDFRPSRAGSENSIAQITMLFEGPQDRTRRSPSTECARFAPGSFQKVPRGCTARPCNPNFMLDLIPPVPKTALLPSLPSASVFAVVNTFIHLLCLFQQLFIITSRPSPFGYPYQASDLRSLP